MPAVEPMRGSSSVGERDHRRRDVRDRHEAGDPCGRRLEDAAVAAAHDRHGVARVVPVRARRRQRDVDRHRRRPGRQLDQRRAPRDASQQRLPRLAADERGQRALAADGRPVARGHEADRAAGRVLLRAETAARRSRRPTPPALPRRTRAPRCGDGGLVRRAGTAGSSRGPRRGTRRPSPPLPPAAPAPSAPSQPPKPRRCGSDSWASASTSTPVAEYQHAAQPRPALGVTPHRPREDGGDCRGERQDPDPQREAPGGHWRVSLGSTA